MKNKFTKYLQEAIIEKVKSGINESFIKELINAFKDGYNTEQAKISIEKEMKQQQAELAAAEKALDCQNAAKKLKNLKNSIHRNSKETKEEIAQLEDAIQYCTKLGSLKAFIKTNWEKGQR